MHIITDIIARARPIELEEVMNWEVMDFCNIEDFYLFMQFATFVETRGYIWVQLGNCQFWVLREFCFRGVSRKKSGGEF